MKLRIRSLPVDTCRALVVGISIFAVGCSADIFPQCAPEKKLEREPELCQGNYHSEAAARHQLAEFTRSYCNLAEWKSRAKCVRKGILRGAELLPLPKKHALLNPIIHSKRT